MRKVLLLYIVFLSVSFSFGQNISFYLSGDWEDETEISLSSYYGLELMTLKKSFTKDLHFIVPDSIYQAVFSFDIFLKNKLIFRKDLLYSGNDLKLNVVNNKGRISAVWKDEGLNLEFEKFNKFRDSIDQRKGLLFELLSTDPSNSFKTKILNELQEMNSSFDKHLSDLIFVYGGNAFGVYLSNSYYYFPDPNLSIGERNVLLVNNYFNNYQPLNPLIVHSPLFAIRFNEYIRLVENISLSASKEINQEDVIMALERFLVLISDDEAILAQVLNVLWQDYHYRSLEAIAQYLDENWLAAQCRAENDIGLQERLSSYERLSIGNKAPEIKWLSEEVDSSGTNSLKDFFGQKVMLIFWASWCPHCEVLLPKIESLLKENNEYIILAIGLDDNIEAWENAKKQYREFIHIRAEQKWDEPMVKAYAIYATPTIYLIDEKNKILGKASNFSVLKSLMEKND